MTCLSRGAATNQIRHRLLPQQDSTCDETKCRANRTHPWVDDETEYTCWVPLGQDNTTDMSAAACADEYIPQVIPNVPTRQDPENSSQILQWYTCCPVNYTGLVQQQCSDIACSSPDWEGGGNCWADGFQEPMSCSSPEFRYPHKTGLMSLIYVQYICCSVPSNNQQELLAARIIWMLLSGITFCVCTVFILAILSNQKVRSQGYNLYLLFLAIPDALANFMIIVRCSLTISGVPVPPNVHIFLASFEYFYATSNMWLNGVIVRQVHHVLRKSHQCVRVPPPSVRLVCRQAGCVYMLAAVFFGWNFFLYERCLMYFDLDQVMPIWVTTRVLMVAPPLLYVIYVCFDVWHCKLLPKTGRTRILSLYFLRVIIVFFVTWVPYFILYEIAWNVTHSRWMVKVSYFLASIQGLVSVSVAMGKPDIKKAVLRFVCPCISKERLENAFILRSRWRTRSSTASGRDPSSVSRFSINTHSRVVLADEDPADQEDTENKSTTSITDPSSTSRFSANVDNHAILPDKEVTENKSTASSPDPSSVDGVSTNADNHAVLPDQDLADHEDIENRSTASDPDPSLLSCFSANADDHALAPDPTLVRDASTNIDHPHANTTIAPGRALNDCL